MKTLKLATLPFILILLLFNSPAYGAEPTVQAEKFFLALMKGNINGAYDEIFAGTGIMEANPQSVQMLKMQTQSAFQMYGKAFAFEKIHDEQFSPSLIRLVYLLKFDLLPVTWEMYFYKPRDDWKLSKILFMDQFQNVNSMK